MHVYYLYMYIYVYTCLYLFKLSALVWAAEAQYSVTASVNFSIRLGWNQPASLSICSNQVPVPWGVTWLMQAFCFESMHCPLCKTFCCTQRHGSLGNLASGLAVLGQGVLETQPHHCTQNESSKTDLFKSFRIAPWRTHWYPVLTCARESTSRGHSAWYPGAGH